MKPSKNYRDDILLQVSILTRSCAGIINKTRLTLIGFYMISFSCSKRVTVGTKLRYNDMVKRDLKDDGIDSLPFALRRVLG